MEKVLFSGDGSQYARELVLELEEAGTGIETFELSMQLELLLVEGLSAVIIVNPHSHAARAARKVLEKAGGIVSRTPIIAALAHAELLDERDTLKYVDEFIVAPAGAVELEARVAMIEMRRGGKGNVIVNGDLLVNLDAHQVFLGGKPVDFTCKEFELLKMMAATPGRAYSREELLRSVWGYDYFGGTRTVDVHIRRLRAKIETTCRYIDTVHGVGYRFTAGD